ncbi:MAG: archease [Phycisphaerae bacterium]|nr:archease [Phycisphaerae bacterium]
MSRYEFFDHTADIGVRVRAPSLPGLIEPCTEGLYAIIGEIATAGEPTARTIDISGDDPAIMLRDYLAELLYLFDEGRRCFTDIDAREFTPERLVVAGQARPVDKARSFFEREVKAITYHELAIRPVTDGYEATYIVDI